MGRCSSDKTYSDNSEYTEECCLAAGVHTLNCLDSEEDGWHGGFIVIQGRRYCENFNDGSRKTEQIHILQLGQLRKLILACTKYPIKLTIFNPNIY